MMALTATATPRVRLDILKQLAMKNPKWYCIVLFYHVILNFCTNLFSFYFENNRFVSSFNRPNLKYSVLPKKSRAGMLVELPKVISTQFNKKSKFKTNRL